MRDESRVRKLRREERVLYGCGCRPVESFAPGIRDEDVAAFMERATRERCPKCAREERDRVRTPFMAAQRAADWPED